MKKTKIIGLVAGAMTLAIAAGSTYAWFTSQADTTVTVNAAQIKIASVSITPDENEINNRLPGEEITVDGLALINESSRESIVKIMVTLDKEASQDGDGAPLRDSLIQAINRSIEIDVEGIRADGGEAGAIRRDGAYYIWLDKDEDPDNFKFTFTIPNELGGNVDRDHGPRTPDQENEHLSKLIFKYEAVAIQGTEAAVADYFGRNVAGQFF